MNSKLRVIAPGATLGVFGGGQLGRMFTHAAQRLGYRVIVFTDEIDSPAGQVAQETIQADYLDSRCRSQNLQNEWRSSHLSLRTSLSTRSPGRAEITLVRPGVRVLSVAQHRLNEKRTLKNAGFPVTPFYEIRSSEDIGPAAAELGWPMVLKTGKLGLRRERTAQDCQCQ